MEARHDASFNHGTHELVYCALIDGGDMIRTT
jgi:hypothetical protein